MGAVSRNRNRTFVDRIRPGIIEKNVFGIDQSVTEHSGILGIDRFRKLLSARTHESDKVEAIDLGADDYITKPFGASELLARIRMALRHTQTMSQNAQIARTGQFHSGGLTIDYNKYRVYVDGVDAQLTQGEYRIVALLGKYAGRVLTYDFLMKELWGPCSKGDNKILRVNMANIRRKIEKTPAQPKYIFTEVGVGYRMAEGDEP